MAQCLEDGLGYELGAYHTVEESVAVHRYGEEDGGVLREERAWFVGDDDDLCTGLPRHAGADLILGGIPGKLNMMRQSSFEMLHRWSTGLMAEELVVSTLGTMCFR